MARNRIGYPISNLGDMNGHIAADQSQLDGTFGTTGADVLVGGGSDTIDGLGGADTITVQDNDSVYLYGSEASITATDSGATLLLRNISAGFAIDLSNSADQSSGDAAVVTGFTNVDASEATWAFGVTITGDDQDNIIVGGNGCDVLTGGDGNDTIISNEGSDVAYGGDGDDFIQLGPFEDVIYGGSGNDTVGMAEGEVYWGGDGDDVMIADDSGTLGFASYFDGGDGVDTADFSPWSRASLIEMRSSADGAWHAFYHSGQMLVGVERVIATNYNDTIVGSDASDWFLGGAGNDKFVFSTALGSDNVDTIADFTSGVDKIQLDAKIFRALTTEGPLTQGVFGSGAGKTAASSPTEKIFYNTTDGSLYYDADGRGSGAAVKFAVLQTDGHAATLTANDIQLATSSPGYFQGFTSRGGSSDGSEAKPFVYSATNPKGTTSLTFEAPSFLSKSFSVTGGAGSDVLTGGDAADKISGGTGNDTLDGGWGNDSLYGGNGKDVMSGDDGDDKLFGGNGNDVMSGDLGNDTLAGGGDNDVLDGGYGNDSLSGDGGNDSLIGGVGLDTLNGGTGKDTLDGGEGADKLIGGSGVDLFVFSDFSFSGVDTISDFKGDKIGLSKPVFGLDGVALQAGDFKTYSSGFAADTNTDTQKIIYDKATGNLFFNSDGATAGGLQLFAHLDNKAALTASDFTLI